MLMPSKTKYRKRMKGRLTGQASQGNQIVFGSMAIQATDRGYVSARQIEASRRAITRHLKRIGKVWIRIFPDKPLTKRAAETRMGKGKGSVEKWVAVVKPGRILFEIDGVDAEIGHRALTLARYKLAVKSTIIKRNEDL